MFPGSAMHLGLLRAVGLTRPKLRGSRACAGHHRKRARKLPNRRGAEGEFGEGGGALGGKGVLEKWDALQVMREGSQPGCSCRRTPTAVRSASRRGSAGTAYRVSGQCTLARHFSTDDLLRIEVEGDFGGRIRGAVGSVHRIALNALGELPADGPGGCLGWVGGAHHVAIDLDGVLAF